MPDRLATRLPDVEVVGVPVMVMGGVGVDEALTMKVARVPFEPAPWRRRIPDLRTAIDIVTRAEAVRAPCDGKEDGNTLA